MDTTRTGKIIQIVHPKREEPTPISAGASFYLPVNNPKVSQHLKCHEQGQPMPGTLSICNGEVVKPDARTPVKVCLDLGSTDQGKRCRNVIDSQSHLLFKAADFSGYSINKIATHAHARGITTAQN